MAPDGSVIRTTRYLAKPAYEEELRTWYDLPVGGAWATDRTVKFSEKLKRDVETVTHRYEVTRRYAPGEAIPTDFVRRAEQSGRAARNEIRLKVRDLFFVKWFDYEERFRDIATVEGFEAALRRHGAIWAGLAGEPPRPGIRGAG